jgi:hypothetical protein
VTIAFPVSTPQFRTALIRKLANLAPGFAPRFEPAPRGIAFRMFDARGRARSEIVVIYRNDGTVLQRMKLLALLDRAGFPKAA